MGVRRFSWAPSALTKRAFLTGRSPSKIAGARFVYAVNVWPSRTARLGEYLPDSPSRRRAGLSIPHGLASGANPGRVWLVPATHRDGADDLPIDEAVTVPAEVVSRVMRCFRHPRPDDEPQPRVRGGLQVLLPPESIPASATTATWLRAWKSPEWTSLVPWSSQASAHVSEAIAGRGRGGGGRTDPRGGQIG